MNTESRLNAHEVRRVAVEAATDPRTVRRYLAQEAMKSTTSARVRDALAKLGLMTEPPRAA